MKKYIASIFFLIAVFLLNCSGGNSNFEHRAIEKLIGEYSSVFDSKDYQKFSEYCTTDMKFFTLDGQVFDRETMVPFLGRMVTRWQQMESSLDELEIKIGGSIAWARYRQQIHYATSAGEGTMRNLITTGLIKENGRWKIGHFHMSTGY